MLILSGHNARVHTLAFSPDGLTLASIAGKGLTIWRWDLASGTLRDRIPGDRRVVSLAFSPSDPGVLAAANSLGSILRWHPKGNGQHWKRVTPPMNHPVRVTFSPDASLLAANGRTGDYGSDCVFAWRASAGYSGEAIQFHGPRGSVTCLSFSSDSRTLAAGSIDGWVYLWSASEGHDDPVRFLHHQVVHFVAHSPDGRTIVSANQRGLVKVWDVESGRCRGNLKGQAKALHGIAFSPDGATLATGSGDGQVRFWDVETKRLRRAFDWGIGPIHSIAFAADGLRAAAGGDRDILVWDIDEW
jgi:WD40 repeat protein